MASVEMPSPTHPPGSLSNDSPLFHEYMARYLTNSRVQQWLLCREPEGVRSADAFDYCVSYACLYYVPLKGASRNSQAHAANIPPFLDAGDFMMFHRTFDHFAVGSLYTTRESHALAQLRDSVGETGLSTVPKSRRFATDLAADALELIEFAWMEDDSLIVSCRRLSKPETASQCTDDMLPIQGDILFYDVIPPDANPGVPRKRMTLYEQPAKCTFCVSRKLHACDCTSFFKRQASPSSRYEHPSRKIYKLALDIVAQSSSGSSKQLVDGCTAHLPSAAQAHCPQDSSHLSDPVDTRPSSSVVDASQCGQKAYNQNHAHHAKRKSPFDDGLHRSHNFGSDGSVLNGETSEVTHSVRLCQSSDVLDKSNNAEHGSVRLPSTSAVTRPSENEQRAMAVAPTFSTCGSSAVGCDVISSDLLQDNSDHDHQLSVPEKRMKINQLRYRNKLATIANLISRLHTIDQSGSFFVRWYESVPNSKYMRLTMEPPSPFSYQFLCGTREQTNILAARFINDMKLCQNAFMSDARFYSSLTTGANINMLVSKENSDDLANEYLDDYRVFQGDHDERASALASSGYYGDCQVIAQAHYMGVQCQPGAADWYRKTPSVAVESSPNELDVACGNSEQLNEGMDDFGDIRNGVEVHCDGRLVTLNPADNGISYEHHVRPDPPRPLLGTVSNDISAVDCTQDLPPATLHDVFHGNVPVSEYSSLAGCSPPESRRFIFGESVKAGTGEQRISSLLRAGACGSLQPSLADRDTWEGDTHSDEFGESSNHVSLPYRRGGFREQDLSVEPKVVFDENGVPMCSACHQTFTKTGNLTRHIQTVHLKNKPYQCDQCSSRFGHKTHLNRHIQTVHNRANVVHCQECRREFKSQQQLDRHFQQAHSGGSSSSGESEQIRCEECGHAFSQRSNLNRHIQSIHQRLRHQCPVCPSSFGQRFDLQRHVQRYMDNGDEAHSRALSMVMQR